MASEGPLALPESAPVSVPVKTGPPKKGEGKPPSIAQRGISLSKVPVKVSSFLPVPANPPTMVADKALLEAQKVARDIKKSSSAGVVKGGRSIKTVEIILPAGAGADSESAGAPVAEKPAGLLDNFFGEAAEPAPEAAAPPSIKVFKPAAEEDEEDAATENEEFNFASRAKPVKQIKKNAKHGNSVYLIIGI